MDIFADIRASLHFIYPELILSAFFLIAVATEPFLKRHRGQTIGILTLIGLVAAFIALLAVPPGDQGVFRNMMAADGLAFYFKVICCLVSIVAVLMSYPAITETGEFYMLLLGVTVGMFFMISAADLLMIFLSIELVSATSFIMAGYLKRDLRSSEAGLKYILFGAASSGLMLYGLSILYGLTGSTNLWEIRQAIQSGEHYRLAVYVGTLFAMSGFGFKIACVPFHFWCPDVYEGAPTPVTAFLSVGPKAAGFGLLIRFFYSTMAEPQLAGQWAVLKGANWPVIVAAISAVSMTLGNFSALLQQNVKRMLAYSTIAHAGYILMGFVTLTDEGLGAILFYLTAYLFMNLGAFAIVFALVGSLGGETVADFRGLGSRAPFAAVAMTIFLFALTGLPPTAGFIGKFYLFAAVINAAITHPALYWLAIIGVLNSVVSLYYYTRIVKVMFFETAEHPEAATIAPVHTVLMVALLIPTVGLGLFWGPVKSLADASLRLFLGQ